MAEMPDSRLYDCIPCMDLGRACDQVRSQPCGPCKEAKELFCTWYILDRNRVNRNTTGQSLGNTKQDFSDIRTPRPPTFSTYGAQSPSSNGDFNLDMEREWRISQIQNLPWIVNSSDMRHLIRDCRSCDLLYFDPELCTLLLMIDPTTGVGQQELATAIISASSSYRERSGYEASINYYNTAIGAIQRTLCNIGQSLELQLAGALGISICLARLFEFYDAGTTRTAIHLAAIRELTSRAGPLSPVSGSVIKSSLYHTAIGSTFSFTKTASDLPLSYISDLRKRLSATVSSPMVESSNSFLGLPLWVLDFAFQIAQARHEANSTGLKPETRKLLVAMRDFLGSSEMHASLAVQQADCPRTGEAQERLMHLYWAALVVLLRKTIDCEATRLDLRPVVKNALNGIEKVDITKHDKTILWPLLVLYFAAQPVERQRIWRLLDQLQSHINVTNLGTTLDFLYQTEESNLRTPENVIEVLLYEDVDEINIF